MIKFCPLFSSSSGNSVYIGDRDGGVLVDVGRSAKQTREMLSKIGVEESAIKAVFLTHEHSDHTCAIPRVSRIVPLYAHPETAKAIYDKQKGLLNYKRVDFYENGFYIGDIEVLPFRISHDAKYPLGYTFRCGDAKISIATDMGIVAGSVYQNIKDSQYIIFIIPRCVTINEKSLSKK